LVKKFDVKANILFGNIDRIKDVPYGNLTLELLGTPDLIQQSMSFLKSNGLEVEVL
jgi:D-methionine transport system ATP-binding protein